MSKELERFGLDGRNAIVTGGSTGIGREVVKGLCGLGADVLFNSTEKSKDDAESLIDELSGNVRKVLWVSGDVREEETIKNILSQTKDNLGTPHIFVSCAGITRDGAFIKQEDSDFRDVYDIKVSSARKITQQVLRDMSRDRWGRIVYIGSIAADGSPWQVNYAMANSALEGLAKSIALGYANRGISANVIKPALVESKLTRPPLLDEKSRQKIIDEMPIGRILDPREVADGVLMLVAQRTASINGQMLYIDGGLRRA